MELFLNKAVFSKMKKQKIRKEKTKKDQKNEKACIIMSHILNVLRHLSYFIKPLPTLHRSGPTLLWDSEAAVAQPQTDPCSQRQCSTWLTPLLCARWPLPVGRRACFPTPFASGLALWLVVSAQTLGNILIWALEICTSAFAVWDARAWTFLSM